MGLRYGKLVNMHACGKKRGQKPVDEAEAMALNYRWNVLSLGLNTSPCALIQAKFPSI